MNNLNLIWSLIVVVLFASCQGSVETKGQSNKEELKNAVENLSLNSTDDVTVHFTKYGDQKELIVFVHGWSCDQTYWKKQVDFFKENYQVITLDLAGHGKSTQGSRDNWTISNLAKDLVAVVKSLTYDQVTLIGHSMGSMVVIEAATQLDGESTRVIAVDYLKRPLRPAANEAIDGFLEKFRADFENSTKGFVARMFRPDADSTMSNSIMHDMSSAPPAVALPLMKDLTTRDFTNSFKTLVDKRIPRYILNSDLSPIDESHYQELGFKLEMIPETGHFLMLEKPLLFNQRIQGFL